MAPLPSLVAKLQAPVGTSKVMPDPDVAGTMPVQSGPL
jgi:hypothetical protein